jgi:hypothetical protein
MGVRARVSEAEQQKECGVGVGSMLGADSSGEVIDAACAKGKERREKKKGKETK